MCQKRQEKCLQFMFLYIIRSPILQLKSSGKGGLYTVTDSSPQISTSNIPRFDKSSHNIDSKYMYIRKTKIRYTINDLDVHMIWVLFKQLRGRK